MGCQTRLRVRGSPLVLTGYDLHTVLAGLHDLFNLPSAAVMLVLNYAIGRWSVVLRHPTILVVNLWHLRGLCGSGRIQRAGRLQTTLDRARPANARTPRRARRKRGNLR